MFDEKGATFPPFAIPIVDVIKNNSYHIALNQSEYKPPIRACPRAINISGLHQVWRQITVQTVLTQEEILEEGGYKKNGTNINKHIYNSCTRLLKKV